MLWGESLEPRPREVDPLARRFSVRALLLCLVAPAVFYLYSARPALSFLSYLVLLPWVVVYTDPRRPRTSHVWYLLTVWIAWVLLNRQAWQYGWFAPWVMAWVCIPFWFPFTPLLRRVHRHTGWPRAITVPIVWTAVEWLRSRFSAGHWDVYGLGYWQANRPWLVQIAEITGVYGVTFLLAACNGLLADLYFVVREAAGARAAGRALVASRPIRVGAATVAAIAFATCAFGIARPALLPESPGPRVAVIQPNVRHTFRNVVGVELSQLLQTTRAIRPGSVDLVVWPENAILDYLEPGSVYADDLAWLSRTLEAPILVGAIGRPEDEPTRTTNTAVLIDAKGTIRGRYVKQALFAWSEYVPLDSWLGRVSPFVQRLQRSLASSAWGFRALGVPGTRTTLLELPWKGGEIPFGAIICVEGAYPPIPTEASRQGARFLINVTSEGEVGGFVQEQLLRVAMIRAIENRVPYVRCGNTGISCIVDAKGRLRSVLRGENGRVIAVAGSMVETIPLTTAGPTLYARSHDAFAWLCLLAAAAMALRRRPVRSAAVAAASIALASACSSVPPIGSDPARAAAALESGRDLAAQDRHLEALRAFGEACADVQVCADALQPAAESFRRRNAPEDAVDFFSAVAAKHPKVLVEASAYEAYFLESVGRGVEAERTLVRAAANDGSSRSLVRLGMLRFRMGRYTQAVDALERAGRTSPDDPRIAHEWARALQRAGRIEEARALLERVTAAEPSRAASWAMLARVRQCAADAEGADAAAHRALEIDPKNLDALHTEAMLALVAGRSEEAEAVLARIVGIEATLERGPRDN